MSSKDLDAPPSPEPPGLGMPRGVERATCVLCPAPSEPPPRGSLRPPLCRVCQGLARMDRLQVAAKIVRDELEGRALLTFTGPAYLLATESIALVRELAKEDERTSNWIARAVVAESAIYQLVSPETLREAGFEELADSVEKARRGG